MSDDQDHADFESLEELPDDAVASAPPAAASVAAPAALGAQPAHKQLYQFLWGGIAVLFGCLLPFNSYAPAYDAGLAPSGHVARSIDLDLVAPDAPDLESKVKRMSAGVIEEDYSPRFDNSVLRGPIGLHTFAGAVVCFAALLFVGAQWYCMRFRKVMLGPIFLMLSICVWSWMRFLGGMGAVGLGFKAQDAPATEAYNEAWNQFIASGGLGFASVFYDGQYLSDYFTHIGPGYLFTLVGSTYVMLIFLGALVGIGSGKKKAAAPAPAKGRGGRRR